MVQKDRLLFFKISIAFDKCQYRSFYLLIFPVLESFSLNFFHENNPGF